MCNQPCGMLRHHLVSTLIVLHRELNHSLVVRSRWFRSCLFYNDLHHLLIVLYQSQTTLDHITMDVHHITVPLLSARVSPFVSVDDAYPVLKHQPPCPHRRSPNLRLTCHQYNLDISNELALPYNHYITTVMRAAAVVHDWRSWD